MTFQALRAHVESKVYAAYQALNPPVEVIFDNTFETPPDLPYVICIISYPSTTVTTICQEESGMEQIRGNLQLSCYGPRGRGMKAQEEFAATGMQVMNTMYDCSSDVRVKCGQIAGPTSVTTGDEPYVVTTLSCPFTAAISEKTTLITRNVILTNPTTRKVNVGTATTKEVGLTHPVGGMKTQEDANQHFDKRLKDLEATHDDHKGHDAGTY